MHSLLLSNPVFNSLSTNNKANIFENKQSYLIELEVPGFDNDNFTITATHNSVSIQAKRKVAVPEGYKSYRQEFDTSNFQRSFRFRGNIDAESIIATSNNGVLSITIPKDEVRVIEVQTV
jgi:HSP20 family protein